MGIDFQSQKNRGTYTTRKADETWEQAIKGLVPIGEIQKAVDIGCGGGIYSKALSDMGIESVTAVDFSMAILDGAKESCQDYPAISFQHGSAYESGLENDGYELLLERALIHHLDQLSVCFKEAHRILKDDGYYLVQDRTPEDCLIEGSSAHIRGYFFELFPRLIEKETKRRYTSETVLKELKDAGFRNIEEITLWETRQVYDSKEQLLQDLRARTGRSILHELNNTELEELIRHMDVSIKEETNIIEKDRWTIWKAVK